MGMGLKKTNGDNYFRPAWFRDEYAKWRTEDK